MSSKASLGKSAVCVAASQDIVHIRVYRGGDIPALIPMKAVSPSGVITFIDNRSDATVLRGGVLFPVEATHDINSRFCIEHHHSTVLSISFLDEKQS